MALEVGMNVEKTITVTLNRTARHVGSGDLRVFATPEMVWLLESVCTEFMAAHMPEGETTVGVMVHIRHLAPTPVGMKVTVRAELTEIKGRLFTFHVVLHDEQEKIGEAEHTRAAINTERFLKRVEEKQAAL